MCSPKVTSTSSTPAKELTPRFSEKAYSPRVSELRGERTPRRGPQSPKTGEVGPSQLGISPRTSTSDL